MLVIGKLTEVGSDSLPVRGQCQPHTKGWRLRIFKGGKEELLFEDTYYACRELQIRCLNLTDDEVREKIGGFIHEITAGLEDTQRMPGLSHAEQATVKLTALDATKPNADNVETQVIPKDDETPESEWGKGGTEVISRDDMDAHLKEAREKNE